MDSTRSSARRGGAVTCSRAVPGAEPVSREPAGAHASGCYAMEHARAGEQRGPRTYPDDVAAVAQAVVRLSDQSASSFLAVRRLVLVRPSDVLPMEGPHTSPLPRQRARRLPPRAPSQRGRVPPGPPRLDDAVRADPGRDFRRATVHRHVQQPAQSHVRHVQVARRAEPPRRLHLQAALQRFVSCDARCSALVDQRPVLVARRLRSV
mmetsp:Transcript_9729/g.22509  ORF Transcript_9729/g.22509 Transcript_9729/m.22509 type:complete len:207 (+) Transcript_9729:1315-1935(+)